MEWKLIEGRDAFVFLSRLIALSLPLYVVMFFADLYAFQVMVASSSHILLEGMGMSVIQEGASLTANGFQFFISQDSTGWKSMLFLGALVLAVPEVFWRRRIVGLLVGIPIIYLGNLGRVIAIVMVEQAYGFQAAMVVHDYLWRIGLIGIVLSFWGVWFYLSRRIK